MGIAIRPARADDARFLAVSTLIAHRSHVNFCSYDLLFDTEPEILQFFARMANAEPASQAHHSRFLVAEVDGTPAAALCGFTAGEHVRPEFLAALGPVLRGLGIDEAEQAARTARVAAWETCPYPSKPGEWVVEWVGTLPEFRRRGLIHVLLEAILAKGRATGHSIANVAHLIGNDAAQRAYEKVGFVAWQDVCHPEFERATRAPGIRRLRRPL
jgi:GNAT superfamily N-acetyltransferase